MLACSAVATDFMNNIFAQPAFSLSVTLMFWAFWSGLLLLAKTRRALVGLHDQLREGGWQSLGESLRLLPKRLSRSPLKPITADEFLVLCRKIAKACDVNAVCTPALFEAFRIKHRQAAACAAAPDVIHQVMTKHARAVSHAVRIERRGRIEHDSS